MTTIARKFYNLRNDKHEESIIQSINAVHESGNFFDVSLMCGNEIIKCHKLVLFTKSLFFKEIFSISPHPHPLIYLKDVGIDDM